MRSDHAWKVFYRLLTLLDQAQTGSRLRTPDAHKFQCNEDIEVRDSVKQRKPARLALIVKSAGLQDKLQCLKN